MIHVQLGWHEPAAASLSLFSVSLALMLSSCAAGPFGVEIRHAGKFDPARDKAAADAALALPWTDNYDDVEITNEPPDGVRVLADRVEADPTRFEVLGSVRTFMAHTRQVAFARSVFWYEDMHPVHGDTRDVVCKIQTPLRTLTLGIFALISPTSWFCYVLYSTDQAENAAIHEIELKRAARAMGGNLVILTNLRAEIQSYVAGYGFYTGIGHESVPGASALGWVLIDQTRRTRGATEPQNANGGP